MMNYLKVLFVIALLFGSADINRNVYNLRKDQYPLLAEFEKLRETEKAGSAPVTAFEECIGGVCPIR